MPTPPTRRTRAAPEASPNALVARRARAGGVDLNLRLDLAYDGAPFHGFARQPDVRTVQGDLEAALERLLRLPEVVTACAGRTDAGVHAVGQVVSVEGVADDVDADALKRPLNAICGPAIAVWNAALVPDGWSARFSARSRLYVYSVLEGQDPDPWLGRTSLHHPEELDLDAMNEAAGHLLGRRDFRSFGRPTSADGSTERTLFELSCSRRGRLVRIKARADGFIQQMVRSLAGTLIEVGEGKRGPDEMPGVLEARERAAAGAVAPPHGLCLVSVEYDEGWSRPFDPLLPGRVSS